MTLQQWHDKMGHLGEGNLKQLEKMFTGMDLSAKPEDSTTCEPCVMGRMTESPHQGHIMPGSAPLNLIHTDLCGPFSVAGCNGECYFLSIIDNFTQWSEVRALKHKYEAMATLKRWSRDAVTPGGVHRIR